MIRPHRHERSPCQHYDGPVGAIDWSELRRRAIEAAANAYAPYSKLQVGAAGLTDGGRIVTGCNVENASYGLTLCAECGLVSSLHVSGGGGLIAVVCVAGSGELLAPCGRCRQLLYEAGGRRLQVLRPGGPVAITELLPEAFGPDDLPTGDG